MAKQASPFQKTVVLKQSIKKAPAGKKLTAVKKAEAIEVTLRIRRKKEVEEALKEVQRTGKFYTREEYQQNFGLNDADVAKVHAFADASGLSVVHTSYARRSILQRGTAENMQKAFGVALSYYQQAKGKAVFRGRTGAVKIPKALDGIIEGVFGLDNRPQATPKYKVAKKGKVAHLAAHGFYPTDLATVYNFPKADGTGQVIGIIEYGGGHTLKDLNHYFTKLKLPMPVIKSVAVGNGHNNPGTRDDDEVMLDIEVAAAIAPKATIVMYYAENSSKGFVDSITQAVHDTTNRPTVISISWGGAENGWTAQTMTNFNEACKAAALMGVSICLAAGDSGSDDSVGDGKAHADFPASSPYVLACGGTKLLAASGKRSSEVVWNEAPDSATGGGVSEFFPLPDYQAKAGVPVSVNKSKFKGRGVPDVAAVADPATGYKVYYKGASETIGGTSAVAPLMAGLLARINQLNGRLSGFIHPKIYNNPTAFFDVTQGNNITTTTNKGYTAVAGWDACTGLGVPDGTKLKNAL
jgi:kumamolisin